MSASPSAPASMPLKENLGEKPTKNAKNGPLSDENELGALEGVSGGPGLGGEDGSEPGPGAGVPKEGAGQSQDGPEPAHPHAIRQESERGSGADEEAGDRERPPSEPAYPYTVSQPEHGLGASKNGGEHQRPSSEPELEPGAANREGETAGVHLNSANAGKGQQSEHRQIISQSDRVTVTKITTRTAQPASGHDGAAESSEEERPKPKKKSGQRKSGPSEKAKDMASIQLSNAEQTAMLEEATLGYATLAITRFDAKGFLVLGKSEACSGVTLAQNTFNPRPLMPAHIKKLAGELTATPATLAPENMITVLVNDALVDASSLQAHAQAADDNLTPVIWKPAEGLSVMLMNGQHRLQGARGAQANLTSTITKMHNQINSGSLPEEVKAECLRVEDAARLNLKKTQIWRFRFISHECVYGKDKVKRLLFLFHLSENAQQVLKKDAEEAKFIRILMLLRECHEDSDARKTIVGQLNATATPTLRQVVLEQNLFQHLTQFTSHQFVKQHSSMVPKHMYQLFSNTLPMLLALFGDGLHMLEWLGDKYQVTPLSFAESMQAVGQGGSVLEMGRSKNDDAAWERLKSSHSHVVHLDRLDPAKLPPPPGWNLISDDMFKLAEDLFEKHLLPEMSNFGAAAGTAEADAWCWQFKAYNADLCTGWSKLVNVALKDADEGEKQRLKGLVRKLPYLKLALPDVTKEDGPLVDDAEWAITWLRETPMPILTPKVLVAYCDLLHAIEEPVRLLTNMIVPLSEAYVKKAGATRGWQSSLGALVYGLDQWNDDKGNTLLHPRAVAHPLFDFLLSEAKVGLAHLKLAFYDSLEMPSLKDDCWKEIWAELSKDHLAENRAHIDRFLKFLQEYDTELKATKERTKPGFPGRLSRSRFEVWMGELLNWPGWQAKVNFSLPKGDSRVTVTFKLATLARTACLALQCTPYKWTEAQNNKKAGFELALQIAFHTAIYTHAILMPKLREDRKVWDLRNTFLEVFLCCLDDTRNEDWLDYMELLAVDAPQPVQVRRDPAGVRAEGEFLSQMISGRYEGRSAVHARAEEAIDMVTCLNKAVNNITQQLLLPDEADAVESDEEDQEPKLVAPPVYLPPDVQKAAEHLFDAMRAHTTRSVNQLRNPEVNSSDVTKNQTRTMAKLVPNPDDLVAMEEMQYDDLWKGFPLYSLYHIPPVTGPAESSSSAQRRTEQELARVRSSFTLEDSELKIERNVGWRHTLQLVINAWREDLKVSVGEATLKAPTRDAEGHVRIKKKGEKRKSEDRAEGSNKRARH
ncbi:hypothetical protein LXA43DRAFT_1063904 [Ganoderma leucocontextum]|nr:hypothetical protein LXA43DRAFT_1063904 [Ganoderma leucocontextum]